MSLSVREERILAVLEAGYQAKHLRVVALRGKPSLCEFCGQSDDETVYDWANRTGDYDDPDDYVRLCRACHKDYDGLSRDEAGRFAKGGGLDAR